MVRIAKCLCVVLCLLLLAASSGTALAGTFPVFSDFSADTAGWLETKEGTVRLSAGGSTLTVSGATDSGIELPLDLVPGVIYSVELYVTQQEQETVSFKIDCVSVLNNEEIIENTRSFNASLGTSTRLFSVFNPGAHDRCLIRVTPAVALDSFELSDVCVDYRNKTFPMDIPSLKDFFAEDFLFGTAVSRSEAMDIGRMGFYASQFNIFTAGNEMKPDSLLDVQASRKLCEETGDETAVVIKLDNARPLLSFCQRCGYALHGHTLLWHEQTPSNLFHLGYDTRNETAGRDIMLARMENYIKGVMEAIEAEYPGVIVSWDVVNEAVSDSTGNLRDCNWLRTVGDDYVLKAFEFARKYAPEGTLLCYNDYNTAMSGKLKGIVALLEQLIEAGTVDCYGFQSHHGVSSPDLRSIRQAMDRIAALGIKMRVSEMDITINGKTTANLQAQARRYALLMKMFRLYGDQMVAVQVWGVTDDLSWRSSQFPLLFNLKGQPKAAFWEILKIKTVEE